MAIPARGADPLPEEKRFQAGGGVPPTTPAGAALTLVQPATRPRTLAATLLRSLRMRIGLGIFAVFALVAIFGPLIVHTDPQAMSSAALQPPSAAHLLGTTQTGQDVLSQLVNGARTSLTVGFVAGFIATALSVIFGVTSGYLGGAVDEGISMVSNIFLVIPALPLLIVLASYLTAKGPLTIGLVISVTGWAWGARVMRAQTLSMRKRDFVEAARASGESSIRIIFAEILPNELAIVASSFIGTVIYAIITEASLAFLGLSDVTMTSWGTMLYWAENNNALLVGAWWWFVPPGLCIALVGAGLALVNFGIDEVTNPRLRSSGSRGPTSRLTAPVTWRAADEDALRTPLPSATNAETH